MPSSATDSPLYNSIHGIPYLPPCSDQSKDSIYALMEDMIMFSDRLNDKFVENPAEAENKLNGSSLMDFVDYFSALDINRLNSVFEMLNTASADWYPSYGCVVLYESINVDTFNVSILGLDEWRFDASHYAVMNGGLGSSQRQRLVSAKCLNYSLLPCGPLLKASLKAFKDELKDLISKASKRTGEKRSAGKASQGHQKTPSFIAAIVEQALDRSDEEYKPSGGMTDVGLHTGGLPRSTCWPLLIMSFKHKLGNDDLLNKFLLHFYMHHLDELCAKFNESIGEGKDFSARWISSRNNVEVTFKVLESAVLKAIELERCGYKLKNIAEQIELYRQRLDTSLASLGHDVSIQFRNLVAQVVYEYQRFQVSPPGQKSPENVDNARSDLGFIRKEALQRIDALPGLEKDSSVNVFTSLYSWMEKMDRPSSKASLQRSLVFVDRVELCLFEASSLLTRASHSVFDASSMNQLEKVITRYQVVVQERLESSGDSTERSFAQHRSHELLVVWIACCFFHRSAVANHSLLAQYGIAIRSQDLRVVVTSDKAARDALLNVVSYFRKFEKLPIGSTVFSMRQNNSCGTIHFARKFAKGSTEMMKRWHQEHELAKQRERALANEIRGKQNEARTLRAQIEKERQAYDEANDDYYRARRNSAEELEAHQRRDRASSKRNGFEQRLNAVLKPPSPVINPLPENEFYALPVIFDILMPEDLDRFARFSFKAQRMLFPRPPLMDNAALGWVKWEEEKKYHKKEIKRTWSEHYSSVGGISRTMPLREIFLFPVGFDQPRQIGPTSVDSISSARQCVWFPNFDSSICHEGEVNFFTTSMSFSEMFYTEPMPVQYSSSLNWAIAFPKRAISPQMSTRGNEVYSKVSDRPDRFEKRAFVSFGSLRSFPNQQIRKISNALVDRLLPFDDDAVRVIMRQALFQVGDISTGPDLDFCWSSDAANASLFDLMNEDLLQFAEDIEPAPRQSETIVILTEIAAFISQWLGDKKSRDLVRTFASVAQTWANRDLAQEFTIGSDGTGICSDIFAKQCVLYGYALLAFSSTRNFKDVQDAALVCSLVVQFHNGFVFGYETSQDDLRKRLLALKAPCLHTMSRCIDGLVPFLLSHGSDTLTPALQLVFSDAPRDLCWSRVSIEAEECQGDSYCFEAVSSNGIDHYMINVLTGCVLKNAVPPGRLPNAVLNDPLYRRSFGSRDFRVGITGQNRDTYRTIHSVNGYYYEFVVKTSSKESVSSQQVIVKEVPAPDQPGVELILIDLMNNDSDVDSMDDSDSSDIEMQSVENSLPHSWTSNLPLRLKTLYSHWYSNSLNFIVFRDIPFEQKSAFFLLSLPHGEAYGSSVCLERSHCYKIVHHERNVHVDELYAKREEYEELVPTPSSILTLCSSWRSANLFTR